MSAVCTVLYIEDNSINMTLMQIILGQLDGVEMAHAEDGETGIAMATDLRPAVILMDINLPGIDGLEVTRRLCAAQETRDIPIYAISADTSPHSIQQAIEAGCRDFIGKPFDVRSLMDLVSSHCHA